MPNPLYIRFSRLPLLTRILIMAGIIIIFFGIVIHLIEPQTFPSIWDGIWWAIITTSTVGYGDFAPKSLIGKITATFLIFLGAGLLSTYFVTLAATAASRQTFVLEGKMTFKGSRHFIIIGWNERSREMIQHMSQEKQPRTIVLIDETLEMNPLSLHHVHFIKGRANDDAVLLRANIHHAEQVLITADPTKDELQADMNTILSLLTIKGLCPNVRCVVEILTKEQLKNAERAGADEIIQTNKFTSFIMLNSLTLEDMASSWIYLFNQLRGSDLTILPVSEEWKDANFSTISTKLLTEGMLLVGIHRQGRTMINPPHTTVIIENDELLVMKQQHT